MIHFAEHIGEATSFFEVNHKQVVRFLDTKIVKFEPHIRSCKV